MREALLALNQLQQDGTIERYAIGGAVAASFYIEAMQTEDLDVFLFLPVPAEGLVLLTSIYAALVAQGGVVEREHVRFGEWPVQILTDANELIVEAIREALEVVFDGVPTRVFKAEHLCAIALQTGRIKDILRVAMFLEQQKVDRARLMALTKRFGVQSALERLPAALWQGAADDHQ